MTKNLLIKVCGMRHPDNIRAVSQLPIQYMGFIFYPKSSRYVGMTSSGTGLLPDIADKAISCFDNTQISDIGDKYVASCINEEKQPHGSTYINKVGVFVDASVQDIITHVVNFGLDAIQLHGSETPTFIRNLKATLVPDICPKIKIFKAISIASAEDFDRCSQYDGIVDMFVFDTKCVGYGGSGKQFDWSVLDSYKGNTPFLLSGGIGFEDAERIKSIQHPQLAGIDLNSRFEIEPGLKDVELLKAFINNTFA